MYNLVEENRVLITGSSGMIGTALFSELTQRGFEVIGFDKKENKWNEDANKKTILGDLCSQEDIGKIPHDVDFIVHCAANARVFDLVKNPLLAKENFDTTFNILNFARENNVSKFILASSREVYGNTDYSIHSEDEAYVKNCESPYTASKVGSEALVHSFNQCYGINFAILRYSNVYGKFDESDRVIPLFISLAKEDKDLYVYGEDKILDFTYIDDCIEGTLKAILRFNKAKNETYNIASGTGTSILEVAQMIKEELNSKSSIITKESRTGEVTKFIADIEKADKILGYKPNVSIEGGMRKTIDWYKKYWG